MKTGRCLLLLVLLLGVVSVVYGQSDSIQATWTAIPTEATIGDVITLTLNVAHPEGYRVIMPDFDKTWGDFEVRSVGQPQIHTTDNDTEITSFDLQAAILNIGTFNTPDLPITVYDTDGQAITVNPPPLTITITSVLQEGDTTLRDIKSQVDMVIPQTTALIGAILMIGCVIMGAGVFGVYTIKKRRKVQYVDTRTAYEKAFDELKRIESLNLPASNQYVQYYDLISSCLRQYLQGGLNIPAMERTTTELKQIFRQSELPHDIVHDMQDVLFVCDIARYGSIEPEQSVAYSLSARVSYIIERTRPQPEAHLEPERSVA
jgi:hypothetical protein